MLFLLPNITGIVAGGGNTEALAKSYISGAFGYHDQQGEALGASGNRDARYDFYANRSSSIYGASSTVQPKAITTIFIIKI